MGFPQIAANNRNELLGRRPHHASTPENPYAHSQPQYHHSPFGGGGPSRSDGALPPAASSALGASSAPPPPPLPMAAGAADYYARERHAMREQSFAAAANAQLDEFLERGRAVLGDLGQQREMLKGTQRRLYSAAATLGISGDTIRMVERRVRQDRWIFWASCVVFFALCYLVLRWLR